MARRKTKKESMIIPGVFNGAKVINGNIEAALRFWKRNLKESGVIQELKDRREYTKPTTRRRKQRNDAIRREYIRRIKEQ